MIKPPKYDKILVMKCILGPPCSGKGTQAFLLCETTGLTHLSAGTLLRQKFSPGSEIRKKLNLGQLVATDLVNHIMKEEMQKHDFNVLIDGYPRSVEQAHFLSHIGKKIDKIFILSVSKIELEKRAAKRSFCFSCDKTYREPQICCGIMTTKRDDDTNFEVFNKRLDVFYEKIDRILTILHGPIFFIDGHLPPEEIHNIILKHCS